MGDARADAAQLRIVRALCDAEFQGSLTTIVGSSTWARENRTQVFGSTVDAVRRAFTDFGHAAPEEAIRARTLGARVLDAAK